MKSAVNFFLKNGDIVVVNQISVDFETGLRNADQKASIVLSPSTIGLKGGSTCIEDVSEMPNSCDEDDKKMY